MNKDFNRTDLLILVNKLNKELNKNFYSIDFSNVNIDILFDELNKIKYSKTEIIGNVNLDINTWPYSMKLEKKNSYE